MSKVLKQLLRGSLLSKSSHQAGFTIIESLVAIIVVGILLTAIAPAMVLSVGNRVQARRVEAAVQAAKSYIDGVTTGAIPRPTQAVNNANGNNTKLLNSVNPPTSTQGLICIDRDENPGCQNTSAQDFYIQAFRTENSDSNLTISSYMLGVRVYRADAFSDATPLKKNTPDQRVTQRTVNGGIGDRKAPLVEMTTEIFPSGSKPSFSDFCTRLNGSVGTNNNSRCSQ